MPYETLLSTAKSTTPHWALATDTQAFQLITNMLIRQTFSSGAVKYNDCCQRSWLMSLQLEQFLKHCLLLRIHYHSQMVQIRTHFRTSVWETHTHVQCEHAHCRSTYVHRHGKEHGVLRKAIIHLYGLCSFALPSYKVSHAVRILHKYCNKTARLNSSQPLPFPCHSQLR